MLVVDVSRRKLRLLSAERTNHKVAICVNENDVKVSAIIQCSPQGRCFPGDGENGYRHNEQTTGDTGQIDRQRKLHLHP